MVVSVRVKLIQRDGTAGMIAQSSLICVGRVCQWRATSAVKVLIAAEVESGISVSGNRLSPITC